MHCVGRCDDQMLSPSLYPELTRSTEATNNEHQQVKITNQYQTIQSKNFLRELYAPQHRLVRKSSIPDQATARAQVSFVLLMFSFTSCFLGLTVSFFITYLALGASPASTGRHEHQSRNRSQAWRRRKKMTTTTTTTTRSLE